ncbi:hypothetical protein M433DRAFT_272349 [Acidomyces richmondensis BFW]|nr:hypothetical protein M433DRAFT_272349 [Acidomyces richmondensis BFW]
MHSRSVHRARSGRNLIANDKLTRENFAYAPDPNIHKQFKKKISSRVYKKVQFHRWQAGTGDRCKRCRQQNMLTRTSSVSELDISTAANVCEHQDRETEGKRTKN